MFEIFVCDDDLNVTEYLKRFIGEKFPEEYRVIGINSGRELIGMIEMNERIPDMLIMEINLKDGNGIEIVKEIQRTHPKVKVIYLTGKIDYATAIFETDPSYFLTKPVNENELCRAICKVKNRISAEKSDRYVVRNNGSEVILFRSDIMYAESQARKVLIHNSNGTVNVIYEKIDVLQYELGADFVRCHKSYLVNMKYIASRTNKEFVLTDGVVLPISKPNLKEAKMRFNTYLGEVQ